MLPYIIESFWKWNEKINNQKSTNWEIEYFGVMLNAQCSKLANKTNIFSTEIDVLSINSNGNGNVTGRSRNIHAARCESYHVVNVRKFISLQIA